MLSEEVIEILMTDMFHVEVLQHPDEEEEEDNTSNCYTASSIWHTANKLNTSCVIYFTKAQDNVTNTSYYNKRNAHFDVQEFLLQFQRERHEMWQEYGEA